MATSSKTGRVAVSIAGIMALVFCLAGKGSEVKAGALDSITKSAESSGGYVERKSGSRSDTKQFPIYRWDSPGLKIQAPVAFRVAKKSKNQVQLKSKDDVSIAFEFDSVAQEKGQERLRHERTAAEESQKSSKIARVSEKQIDNVAGFESTKYIDGDKGGRREMKWQGYDADMKRYVIVTANFGKNRYDTNAADYDAIMQSIKWNYKK